MDASELFNFATVLNRMEFADDTHLDVDMLIISAGIRPRDELARESGLQVGSRGGIWVDEYMRTSDANVYAIGEVALYNEGIYGLVVPGYEMADVAVQQITGGTKTMAA
jgi:nitrite reductase (NADH) large subunit